MYGCYGPVGGRCEFYNLIEMCGFGFKCQCSSSDMNGLKMFASVFKCNSIIWAPVGQSVFDPSNSAPRIAGGSNSPSAPNTAMRLVWV
jgi:hypothetical protein